MTNWNGIVSLLIACLELVLIVNILIFSEKTSAVKAALLIISLLFIYQAAEFIICGLDIKNPAAVYLSFADISFLPASSLLFVTRLSGKQSKMVYAVYLPAIFFIIYYYFHITEMQVTGCTVLYASYNYPHGFFYGLCYYSLIIISIIFLYLYQKKEEKKKERILGIIILTGFIFTALPVITAFILSYAGNYYLLNIIESIMCKFAFSIALAAGIYSLSYPKKK